MACCLTFIDSSKASELRLCTIPKVFRDTCKFQEVMVGVPNIRSGRAPQLNRYLIAFSVVTTRSGNNDNNNNNAAMSLCNRCHFREGELSFYVVCVCLQQSWLALVGRSDLEAP